MTTQKIFGKKLVAMDDCTSVFGDNPVRRWYWVLSFNNQPLIGSIGLDLVFMCSITYYVSLSDRISTFNRTTLPNSPQGVIVPPGGYPDA